MKLIAAQTFHQARQALITIQQQNLQLLRQIEEMGVKIADLEREVQEQAAAAEQARQALIQARQENDALRARIPDQDILDAHHQLVDYLSASTELAPALRAAA
jgi:cell division septum initiation protein DivIVA